MADMSERLVDIVKGAVELNLRYAATVVSLATGYVSEIGDMIRESPAPGGQTEVTPEPPSGARRSPILLVGQLNEDVTGAFALNNTTNQELSVNLVGEGELDPKAIELIPSAVTLAPGSGTFVRLKVRMTDAMMENRNYRVTVTVPGLSAPSVEFVVRRLPSSG